MSMLLCSVCDKQFDPDVHVEAEYYPSHKCQDCVYEELEQQHHEWWQYIDDDENWIKENL